ncbi:U3 small nucleolar RNA-associated protein [Musa troglodytarum]|uniref:U3 small nucleolar RNA-associated protein n=1 Tax=Musa troglodytarum TaxID=320322 RepID=A0A9E7JZQ5_9LILI|nr:U3 small nucleolar RNA-associated protein [Musa troglodytarum]
MSSLRNAIPRRTHKERAQPHERKKFGLLEKHKDYVLRARAFHQKEDTLRRLREKAASRNPDEFYFKMVNTRMVDGIHRPKSEANKYTPEELMLMKTQDIGYVLQKVQSEKKKVERLNSALHTLDHQPENNHVYFAEDRKTAASYRELEARQKRVQGLEKLYSDMALQKELQKSGRKRRLREDEIVQPTSRPVYKWRADRKR